MKNSKRFLVIGAHPDDPDIMFGGTAAKLIEAGHEIKFISATNGECGHQEMEPAELAERRYQETQASLAISGLCSYDVLDNQDGTLEPTLENRAQFVELIRQYQPDVVVTHRTCDYHPDHRATGQLVQDASFLLMVPHYCSHASVPEQWPVFAFSWDHFKSPQPFQADAFVVIDDVIDKKLAMLDCHQSQFYEWLPYIKGYKDFDKNNLSDENRIKWLTDNWLCRNSKQVDLFGQQFLEETHQATYAESFQQSEYGRQLSLEEFQQLFV